MPTNQVSNLLIVDDCSNCSDVFLGTDTVIMLLVTVNCCYSVRNVTYHDHRHHAS